MAENKTLAVNKKARHEYQIIDKFEAGIVLTGSEVKSIRNGKTSIAEAFVREKRGELYILGMNIPEYAQKGYAQHDPVRDRKLLMHKKEITRLSSKMAEKGLTIVLLSLYTKGKNIKAEIALCKGKKLHDKREDLKLKAQKREMQRHKLR